MGNDELDVRVARARAELRQKLAVATPPDVGVLTERGRARRRGLVGVGALVLIIAVALPLGLRGQDDASQVVTAPESKAGADGGEVVADERTIPDEPPDVFADIVTDPAELDHVWRRFRMSGDPVTVDLERFVLLFVGFGESGSCPLRLHDVRTDTGYVEIRFGFVVDGSYVAPGDSWPEGTVCTADYNPRTTVVAVARDGFPTGGFILDVTEVGSFALAGSALDTPLADPPSLWGFGPLIDTEWVAEPQRAATGEPVRILLRNDSGAAAHLGDMPILERWDRQRWVPLPEHGGEHGPQAHPAVQQLGHRAGPGESIPLIEVATDTLAPGWYAIRARIAGGGGGHESRAAFAIERDA